MYPALSHSVVQHQEDVKFELQGDRLPNYLRGSMKGDLFLTTSKVSVALTKPALFIPCKPHAKGMPKVRQRYAKGTQRVGQV